MGNVPAVTDAFLEADYGLIHRYKAISKKKLEEKIENRKRKKYCSQPASTTSPSTTEV